MKRPLCPDHRAPLAPVRTFGGTPIAWHCIIGHLYPAARWPLQPVDRRGRYRRWRKGEMQFSILLGAQPVLSRREQREAELAAVAREATEG